jgi:transposase
MRFRDARDRRIAELEKKLAERDAIIAQLEARVKELEALLGQNSSNSSRPPSADPPDVKRKSDKTKKRKRKRGARPGHQKHARTLVPVEQVDEVLVIKPKSCGRCGKRLNGDDCSPRRHQVWELPKIEPRVTEYQLHTLQCDCGACTHAELPHGVPKGTFGSSLMALVSLLTGKYRLSKRAAQELCSDLIATPVSLGAVSNIERTVSEALEAPVDQARDYVQQQSVAHMDETGWREANRKAWLWVVVTSLVTVFQVARSRGSKVVKSLLGEKWLGILVSDRWTAYFSVKSHQRQLCWSHLIRDFTGFVDRGGRGSRIGKKLLKQTKLMFKWWHRVRDGTMSRERFQKKMGKVRQEVGRLLQSGKTCVGTKTAGMCAEILALEPALWTFVDVEGVEPTNNLAERQIRPAVLWRKGCFGTQSERGSRFAERILTVSATLKQQDRHVLSYLTEACEAYLRGEPAPSILPIAPSSRLLAA